MLRLWRGCRPLAARSFSTLPVEAAGDTAVDLLERAVYSERIDRKCHDYASLDAISPKSLESRLDRTTNFLMQRGLDQTAAIRAISKHVHMVGYSPEMMEKKIAWLSKLGLSHAKINSIILRSPNILGSSIEKLEALVEWYLALGVPEERLAYLFDIFPQGASYKITENLDPKVEFLREVGCNNHQVARILTSSVHIFRLSVPRLHANVEYMVELGVTREQLPAILANSAQVLALKPSRIKLAVDALDEMFGEGTGIRALTSSRIVMYNVDGLRRSFDYLVSTVGFTPERLSSQVQLIARSVDGILRPRYEFLNEKGVDVLGEVVWITMAHRLFVVRYPDFEEFLKQYRALQSAASDDSVQ